jgi:hypothetical protein
MASTFDYSVHLVQNCLTREECVVLRDMLTLKVGSPPPQGRVLAPSPLLPTTSYASIVKSPIIIKPPPPELPVTEKMDLEEEEEEDDNYVAHSICGNVDCNCVYTYRGRGDPAHRRSFDHICLTELYVTLAENRDEAASRSSTKAKREDEWQFIKTVIIDAGLRFDKIHVNKRGFAIVRAITHEETIDIAQLLQNHFPLVNYRHQRRV